MLSCESEMLTNPLCCVSLFSLDLLCSAPPLVFSFSFSISLVTHSPSYRPLLLCLSQPSQDSFFDSDGNVIATGLATIQLGDHADITRTRTRRMMMLRTTTHSNNNNSSNNNYSNDRALQDTTSHHLQLYHISPFK